MLMYGVRPFGKAQEPQPECQVIIYAAVPSRFRLMYWLLIVIRICTLTRLTTTRQRVPAHVTFVSLPISRQQP